MNKQLSKREIDVMNILWASNIPLSASEIAQCNSNISRNTIQAVLKTLLENQFIEVSDIIYSGTVLTRTYKPVISMTEYIRNNFLGNPTFQVISSFIDEEENDKVLLELENRIQEKIRNLKK